MTNIGFSLEAHFPKRKATAPGPIYTPYIRICVPVYVYSVYVHMFTCQNSLDV